MSTTFGFPVTLEFRGNAALEILCKDGWSPAHGAAGRGALGDRLILSQLLGEEVAGSRSEGFPTAFEGFLRCVMSFGGVWRLSRAVSWLFLMRFAARS